MTVVLSRRRALIGMLAAGVAAKLAALPAPVQRLVRPLLPQGWLPCDGRSLSRSAHPELFAYLRHKYGGIGDQFNLPDLRGSFNQPIFTEKDPFELSPPPTVYEYMISTSGEGWPQGVGCLALFPSEEKES